MKGLNHKLRWGGFLGGELVHDVKLKAPDSGIGLKLQGVRGQDAITHGALTESTESINGKSVTHDQASEFWRSVKVPDAEEALLEMLKVIWPDDADESPQAVVTINGDIHDNIIVNLNKLEKFEDAVPGFDITLKDGFHVRDQLVKRIKGEVYTLGQAVDVQAYSDKPIEKTYRIIAMNCKDASREGLVLNLKHVQTITPRDRKRIEKEIEEGHQIVNLMIERRIGGVKAYGRVNLASFL